MLWSAQLHLYAKSPHGWDPQLEAYPRGNSDPGGPNDTRRIITNQKQQIKYPCYRIRDTQSLKDKQMHDNVQFTLVQGYNDSDIDTASIKETDSMILVAHQSNQTPKTMYHYSLVPVCRPCLFICAIVWVHHASNQP